MYYIAYTGFLLLIKYKSQTEVVKVSYRIIKNIIKVLDLGWSLML